MQQIDELSRRLPGFSENSIPIRLADGNEWFIPKPMVEIQPVFVGGKLLRTIGRTTHGPEFDEAVEELDKAASNADVVVGIMTVGAFLLRKNYELTDDELEDLFVFRFGTEEESATSLAMVEEISSVVMGRTGKKAGSGGAD